MNKYAHFHQFMELLEVHHKEMLEETITFGYKHMMHKHHVSLSTITRHLYVPPKVYTIDRVAINKMRGWDITDKEVAKHFGISMSMMNRACGVKKDIGQSPIQRNKPRYAPPERVLNTERWVYQEVKPYWETA